MHLLLTTKMHLQLLALQKNNLMIGSMKIQISLKIVTKPSKLFRKELKMEKILMISQKKSYRKSKSNRRTLSLTDILKIRDRSKMNSLCQSLAMKVRMRRNKTKNLKRKKKSKEMKRKLNSKIRKLKLKKKISHLVTLMNQMMMMPRKNYLQSRVVTIHQVLSLQKQIISWCLHRIIQLKVFLD